MTLLRGHFSFMLICAGDASRSEVAAGLTPLTADGSLDVSVREVQPEPSERGDATAYQLAVHGGDRAGIVSALMGVIAAAGGNVTDLSTRLAGHLYVLLAEVDVASGVDVVALQSRIAEVAAGLGVDASLRPMEPDLL